MKGRMEGSSKEKQCGSRVMRIGKQPRLGCWGGTKHPDQGCQTQQPCSLQPEPQLFVLCLALSGPEKMLM